MAESQAQPSHNLKSCLKDLKYVLKNKNKIKKRSQFEFLSHKKCIYDALHEISWNLYKKNIKLTNPIIKKVKPYKKLIRTLAKGVKDKKRRQKLVLQSGGFLPWLLPVIATLLTTTLEKVIK